MMIVSLRVETKEKKKKLNQHLAIFLSKVVLFFILRGLRGRDMFQNIT